MKAELTIIVEFDEYPKDVELTEMLDALRSYGSVVQADFKMSAPIVRDLVSEDI